MGQHHTVTIVDKVPTPFDMAPVRKPSTKETFVLSSLQLQQVMQSLLSHDNPYAMQDLFPLATDIIGIILQYCSLPDILILFSTCKQLQSSLHRLWEDIALVRCGSNQFTEFSLQQMIVPNVESIAKQGAPFYFSPSGPNTKFAEFLAFSSNGQEVWSKKPSMRDVTLVLEQPLVTTGCSCFTVRFSPVEVKFKRLSRLAGLDCLHHHSHGRNHQHTAVSCRSTPSQGHPSNGSSGSHHSRSIPFLRSVDNRPVSNVSFGSSQSSGNSPNSSFTDTPVGPSTGIVSQNVPQNRVTNRPPNTNANGSSISAPATHMANPKPPRIAVGVTQVHDTPSSAGVFFYTLGSSFSFDGVFRKTGAMQAKRYPWNFGDDITVLCNYPERSCTFFVNGIYAMKLWDLPIDITKPVWFFVRIGGQETCRCQIL